MSKVRTFSTPDNWDCLDKVLEKLPRAIDTSGAIRMAVEGLREKLDTTPYVSLDEFSQQTVIPRLDLDKKTWLALFKDMNTTELRDLEKKIQQKLNLVKTEAFERTL